MPTPYIEKLAKEHNLPVDKVESYWEKAKVLAGKAGHKEDYAYITGIVKKMVNEVEHIDYISKFIDSQNV
jgi:hypothetical protein